MRTSTLNPVSVNPDAYTLQAMSPKPYTFTPASCKP